MACKQFDVDHWSKNMNRKVSLICNSQQMSEPVTQKYEHNIYIYTYDFFLSLIVHVIKLQRSF